MMSCIYLALGMTPFCDGAPSVWEEGCIPVQTANQWRAWAVTVLASDGALMGVATTPEQMPRDKVLCRTGGAPQFLRDLYGGTPSGTESDSERLEAHPPEQAPAQQPQAGASHGRGRGKPPAGAGRGRGR
jgi:hypothetical protein